MGNTASCAPSLVPSTRSTVKVLHFSSGRIQAYAKPVRAADVVVENPGHFLCESSGLKVGHRILGLAAEEELERRQLYFLLPMELLYSVLTEEEMSSLTHKASKALKRSSGYSTNLTKIFPLFSEFCILLPSEGCRESEILGSGDGDNSNIIAEGHRQSLDSLYSKQRSWRPALETIAETSF